MNPLIGDSVLYSLAIIWNKLVWTKYSKPAQNEKLKERQVRKLCGLSIVISNSGSSYSCMHTGVKIVCRLGIFAPKKCYRFFCNFFFYLICWRVWAPFVFLVFFVICWCWVTYWRDNVNPQAGKMLGLFRIQWKIWNHFLSRVLC